MPFQLINCFLTTVNIFFKLIIKETDFNKCVFFYDLSFLLLCNVFRFMLNVLLFYKKN